MVHKQSRRMSLTEAVVNVLIGYSVGVGAQSVIFPLFGMKVTLVDNMLIALAFTLVSVMRAYAVRRVFEAVHWRNYI